MTKDEIAHILKQIRLTAGFTQKEAADKLGRKQQTLASWETGQSQPDANTLFVLCSIYGASVDEAFGFVRKNDQKKCSLYSDEALEVAQAYEQADFKERNMARMALDLPLLDESKDESSDKRAI